MHENDDLLKQALTSAGIILGVYALGRIVEAAWLKPALNRAAQRHNASTKK